MADNTKIEWTDATVNAVNGCSVLSPGCKHCYAMKQAHRVAFRRDLVSPTAGGQVWNGKVYLHEKALMEPLRWKKPRRIFWNAHGDLFHPNVPDEWIDRVFAVCALTPQHRHQILTKRPERMREYASDPSTPGRIARVILDMAIAAPALLRCEHWPVQSIGDIDDPDDVTIAWPLPNVWLGTSVEDQKRADERIPHLLATPAAVRFLSCEPLLGPVDLRAISTSSDGYALSLNSLSGVARHKWHTEFAGPGYDPGPFGMIDSYEPGLDWVIVGGESGPGARPMHPDWARSLRDQCAAAGVPFFFKQWGEWAPKGWEHADSRLHLTHAGKIVEKADCDANRDHPGLGLIEIEKVGKKAAGRLLDGVEHDGMPEQGRVG